MDVSIQRNSVKAGTYRVVLHPGERADFEAFLEHVGKSAGVQRGVAMAILETAAEWVRARAAEGREADLGPLGRSRLGMRASLKEVPDQLRDKDVRLTISWILPGKLKKKVAQAGDKLVRERTTPRPKLPVITEVRRVLSSSEMDTAPARYTPNRAVRVYGMNVNYDKSRDDEGVFLIDEAGHDVRPEAILSTGPKQLAFWMPPDAAGNYHLEIRRRHPRSTGPLLRGRYDKPLVPA